jgi:putative ABC transport system permease protein
MFARLLMRSLEARRARLGLALMAVSLGIAVAIMLAALSLGVGDDLARSLRAAGPNFVVLPAGARWPLDLGGARFEPARAGAALGDTVVPALRGTFWKNNLLAAAPELVAPASAGDVPITLIGTWFDHEAGSPGESWKTGVAPLHPVWRVSGRWPREGADEIALGKQPASRLGAHEGSTITLRIAGVPRTLTVSGIVTAGGPEDALAWAPLDRVQSWTGRGTEVDRVWLSALVRPEPRRAPPDPRRDPRAYETYECSAYPNNVARTFRARLAGADVLPMTEVVAGEAEVVERLNVLMVLLGLAALTASTLGLLSTTTATVVERREEIGLLRTLGASSRQLAALLFGETLLVSVLGGIAGWAIGNAAALLVRGGSFGGSGALQPLLLPVAVALAGAVAVVGTLGPLRMALRVEPAGVLRGNP